MLSHTLDRLESRRLLAATALVHKGLLTVRGVANAANTINVAFSSDQSAVDVFIHSVTASGKAANFSQSYSIASVHSLTILGGTPADTINVGQSGPSFNLLAFINSGSENDSITIGAENDIIDGGSGHDLINA
jgi:Ca2+-binding RTX toxin-like protein